ncbi:hypothetical protein COU48_02005 [Candidatus Nomurabacteria bacterium CG10_big_fil_rev_8_21_14_0_10_03_31_7]|uniref:Secretion system C-terminal sorting domain-containing protein n=1 Tax=Candidatus Nomurabacteria bacterium CG10_big_fil_rev_8_21_14_0_10_03_31_7 TaxID=1974730 RepID=A0A2J0JHN5_9BACT|nr:MAG: hypothetical protein COU48_02005 [Candidatus Nomurabacteria bacterium CG10_big_fil_rev_8_21_14_0_10_03_31_7]
MKALYVLTVTFFILISPSVLSQPESLKVTNGWESFDSTGIKSSIENENGQYYQILGNVGPVEKDFLNWWNQFDWLKNTYWIEYPLIPDTLAVSCRFISGVNIKSVAIGIGLEDSLWYFSGYRKNLNMDGEWYQLKFDMNYSIKNYIKHFGQLRLVIHITSLDSSNVEINVAFNKLYGIDDTLGIIIYDSFGNPTGISDPSQIKVPSSFDLSQNYPNPFNPSTKIKFTVPTVSYVSLIVFNSLGQEVQTLAREEKSEGIYEVSFNASNLPSGTYFYRIQAGDFVETKKMLLLK